MVVQVKESGEAEPSEFLIELNSFVVQQLSVHFAHHSIASFLAHTRTTAAIHDAAFNFFILVQNLNSRPCLAVVIRQRGR